MAGKGYPSRGASNAAVAVPTPDYPKWWPDNDNRPRPKPYNRRPGTFPNTPRRWRKPFGRRTGPVYPSPFPRSGFRLGPWAGAASFAAAYLLYKPADWSSALTNAGFKLCCSIGDGDVFGYTNLNNSGCGSGPLLCGVSLQPFGGHTADGPMTFPLASNPRLGARMLIGKQMLNPPDRCTWMQHWMRPSRPSNLPAYQPLVVPGPVQVPVTPDFWLPYDPNWWTPLSPTPYNPNFPAAPPRRYPKRPPRPTPRTWPAPESGPVTVPLPPFVPVGVPTTTTVSVGNPFPVIDTGPIRPVKPTPTTTETKYNVRRSPYALLATRLLQLAAGTHGGITEVVDLVTAMYSAIPADVLARYPDGLAKKDILPFMLGAIYANRNNIDWQEAVHNIAVNQIEDYAWGKYFKAVDDVSRAGPYYQGFDRELGALNELFQQVLPK